MFIFQHKIYHAYSLSDRPTQNSIREPQPTSNRNYEALDSWQRMALVGTLIVCFFGSISFGFHLDVSWIYPSLHLSITPSQTNYTPIKSLSDGLASEGASIVDIWTTTSHLSVEGAPLHPSSLLTGVDNGNPSWCFSGSKGQIGILLRSPSILGAIDVHVRHTPSMFHLPWVHTATAPREIWVWGLIDGDKNRREIQRIEGLPSTTKLFKDTSHVFLPVARFEYNGRITTPDIQQVAADTLLSTSSVRFGLVIVEIRSNWGGASTCLNGINIFEAKNKK